MKYGFLFKALLGILLFLPSVAYPFNVPETLEYQLAWNGIHAGTSTLSITCAPDNTYKIVSTARSANFISLFYEVNDVVESYVKKGSFIPLS